MSAKVKLGWVKKNYVIDLFLMFVYCLDIGQLDKLKDRHGSERRWNER